LTTKFNLPQASNKTKQNKKVQQKINLFISRQGRASFNRLKIYINNKKIILYIKTFFFK
jgi:biopolymer transport protein ExbD